MAKYIIEIENEYTKDWVNETPMCKELCMPISVPNRQRTYHVPTGFKLEPYTEPDRKAIEDEVWEFVQGALIAQKTHPENLKECYNGKDLCEVILDSSYSEVKAKYDKWLKQKNEIHVGDEVIPLDSQYDTMVVTKLWASDYCDDEWVDTIASDGKLFCFLKTGVKKTGRHFPEVEELLRKMEVKWLNI